MKALPKRVTVSDRIKNSPTVDSKKVISALLKGASQSINNSFIEFGEVTNIDETDGVRITFENSNIIHFHPSGNAPELRCYSEEAIEINKRALVIIKSLS